LPQWSSCFATALLAFGLLVGSAQATIPEPDNVVWGAIVLDTQPVTAAQRGVVVEARRSLAGTVLARYRMGDNAAAGNYYVLRMGVESLAPIVSAYASATNTPIVIVVADGSGTRAQKPFFIGPRGQMTRMDIGSVDTDGNGLPNDWERQYFGGSIGQHPNADLDHDGLSNLQEYRAGLNPLYPDARHPADINPTNNALSILEVTAYGLAWKTGQAWSVAPTNIPMDYVTRAAYLWRNGETYVLETNYLAAGAPLWWTNVVTNAVSPAPRVSSNAVVIGENPSARVSASSLEEASSPATNAIVRVLPRTYKLGETVTVTITVTPSSGAQAYAVEDQPPPHWTVGTVGADGRYDAANDKVKWGPFFDTEPRTLIYEVAPDRPMVQAHFAGAGSFDGASLDTSGSQIMIPAGTSLFCVPVVADTKGFAFSLLGEPEQEYEIQISFDLINWTSLARIRSDATGRFDYLDTEAEAGQLRFYRARMVSE
jgi:hypothetical protein